MSQLVSEASVDGLSGAPTEVLKGVILNSAVLDVIQAQTRHRELIKANTTEDVLTVCDRLAENHVSSLPVFDEDNNCTGIVDFSDAVAYLLKMDWESMGSLKNGNQIWDELGNVAIADAIDLSDRNPLVVLKPSTSLLEAIDIFQKNSLRRALVESEEGGDIVAVLSPSAIVQFLVRELKGRNDVMMAATIENLDVGHSPVRTVKKNQTVLEAMHLMHVARHSVVAVVDPTTGALAGSISMSDIKLVFQEKRFSLLVKTCWTYIVEAREKSDTEVFPFFGVYPSDKLQMVVSKLLATSVHHLYVVNEKLQPVRVISFSDVCGALFRECSEA